MGMHQTLSKLKMLKTQPQLQTHHFFSLKSVRSAEMLMDMLWASLMAYKANVLNTLNHLDNFWGKHFTVLYCQERDMKIDTTENCLFSV